MGCNKADPVNSGETWRFVILIRTKSPWMIGPVDKYNTVMGHQLQSIWWCCGG